MLFRELGVDRLVVFEQQTFCRTQASATQDVVSRRDKMLMRESDATVVCSLEYVRATLCSDMLSNWKYMGSLKCCLG